MHISYAITLWHWGLWRWRRGRCRPKPRVQYHRYSRRPHHGANESLPYINFSDILGAQIFDDDDQPPPSPSTHVRHLSSSSPATPAAILHYTNTSFSSTSIAKLHAPTMANVLYPSGSVYSPISFTLNHNSCSKAPPAFSFFFVFFLNSIYWHYLLNLYPRYRQELQWGWSSGEGFDTERVLERKG